MRYVKPRAQSKTFTPSRPTTPQVLQLILCIDERNLFTEEKEISSPLKKPLNGYANKPKHLAIWEMHPYLENKLGVQSSLQENILDIK